jgi:hypothetical protein
MPYIVHAAESNNPDVEDGKYRAIISDMTSEAGTFGDTIRWKFQLQEEPYAGVELSAMSSPTLTPNSKIWPWYVALGFEIEVGMEFDLFAPIGMECWVMVERKPSKKDASIIYSNVTKIVPPPKFAPQGHVQQSQPQAARPAQPMARPAPVHQRPAAPAPGPARPAQPMVRPGQQAATRPAASAAPGEGEIPF